MRPLPPLALALVAAAGPLASQTAAERLRLDSVRTSFASVTDSTALLAREQARIDVARRERDDPFIHMELGYLAYRLGELTGARDHYDAAAGEFEWAAELRPSWPYAHYGQGLSELAILPSDVAAVDNLQQIIGIDGLSQAVRAFARAAEADPAFTPALLALARTAQDQRVRARTDLAVTALRQAAATSAGRTPEVWLARGRMERRAGNADSALAAFREYLALGGDRPVGRVEEARVLAALGHGDSALAAYRAALEPPTSEAGRAELRRDLRWIGRPLELAAFDTVPADSVGAFVAAFWRRRDVDDARPPGDRLLEQFRRYAYAAANFSLVSPRRLYDLQIGYRDTTQSALDDRGVIYMRHGAPDARVRGRVGRENYWARTWVYRRFRPEPNLILHFSDLGHIQGYRLVEDVAFLCSSEAYCDDLFMYDPEVFRLRRPGWGGQRFAAQARDRAQAAIDTALRTDSYRLTFPRDLRPVVSSFLVADAALRPQMHVVFAVPAGQIGVAPGDPSVIRLRTQVLVFDADRRHVAALDTLREFAVMNGVARGAFVTADMALAVPPGAWSYHLVMEDRMSGSGALVRGRTVEVPRFDAGFTASDMVLGREGSGLVWRRPDGDVPLNPLASFPHGDRASVYYELYGLPQGARIETHVRIRPTRQGAVRRVLSRSRPMELSYVTVTDAAGRSRVRQRFDLGSLGTGSYEMEVELTDPVSGRTVQRHAAFDITGR